MATTLGLLWLVAGSVVGAVGVAGARGRLPRQHWAGIRLPSTMRDDTAWYAAHRAGGVWIAGGGALAVGAGLTVLVWQPADDLAGMVAMVVAVALLVPIVMGAIVGVRAARRV